ncbi:dethiobiotin synthase [Synechococcus sp. PCC 7336]|uniref:dethiobiotin synthase n=1 Tax=Synechococcus sp. PCC 7336 TaxID=195250 RepID=UPI00034A8507|nr:dethiobiotin synthase [Synechococcus sp. PCC 7336]
MASCVFVSGTDTGVGKTVVSGLLCRCLHDLGYRVGYYKPVQSGANLEGDRPADRSPDVQLVRQLSPATRTACSYALPLPAAPQLAAELAAPQIEIDLQQLDADFKRLTTQCDVAIVEGAGGLAVPLADQLSISDLICHWQLPLLLVGRSQLGTINHTTLSLAYARQLGINAIATLLNDTEPHLDPGDPILATAPRWIEQLSGYRSLYRLPYLNLSEIDWNAIGPVLVPIARQIVAE